MFIVEDLLSLFHSGLHSRESAADILSLNQLTAAQGLLLTPMMASSLIKARDKALIAAGRLEMYGGVMKKLILAFCDSPFFDLSLAEETFCELIETFYLLKSETFDMLSDDALVHAMRELFDTCHGCIQTLKDAAFDQLIRRAHGVELEKEEGGQADEDKNGSIDA